MRKATPNANGMALQNIVFTEDNIQNYLSESQSHDRVISDKDRIREPFTPFDDVANDAQIMASLLYNMKSGIDTWYHVFTAIEAKYEPFLSEVFLDEFYHHISQHRNFKTLESEIFGGMYERNNS